MDFIGTFCFFLKRVFVIYYLIQPFVEFNIATPLPLSNLQTVIDQSQNN